jgi:hypothetical protein
MPHVMLSRSQDLHVINSRLRSWLDSMDVDCTPSRVATPSDISTLLSELLRAGAGLRAQPIPPKGADPELDGELDEYRRNVERLRELMPFIHHQLLAERTRIETQRARIQLAVEWAQASRQTL